MMKSLRFFSFLFVLFLALSGQALSYDYPKIFDTTYKVMTNKDLYKALNEALIQQKTPLTQSQIVFILQNKPEYIPLVEQALSRMAVSQSESPEAYAEFLKTVKTELKSLVQSPEFLKQIENYASPTNPALLTLPGDAPGYRAMRLFVNHPHLQNPTDPQSKVLPGDDLRQVVVDFIAGAEQEIWYNVFDFDLQVVAEALKNQHLKKNVKVHGGIDAGTIAARSEVKAIFDSLASLESANFKTVAVNSVGLNHQKIIVRDPFGPRAAVLFLSGNFTQSCIGPEGDLVQLPPEKRPVYSIPNANHALIILGSLPAQVTQAELRKTLEFKIRGQSQYPIGGSFKIFGNKQGAKEAPYIILSFSPKGGDGDVNKSIFVPLIQNTQGPIEAVHFAFSSKQIQEALYQRAKRDMDERGRFEFRSVGDTPFALREWSVFLSLSGLKKDLPTGKYYVDAEAPILQALGSLGVTNLQQNIRTAPEVYGERHFRLEDGTALKTTSKIHHKVFIFPEESLAVLGTSFNPSENAESNNEQILIVKDKRIVQQARGFFYYLFNNSQKSVTQEANRRNLRALPDTLGDDNESTTERDQ
ncbi:MAG: hypothetical protein KUL82_09740 [Bdellovibrio sp.]|nr:hypothetical protein [Bdellovibrio sp.]